MDRVVIIGSGAAGLSAAIRLAEEFNLRASVEHCTEG